MDNYKIFITSNTKKLNYIMDILKKQADLLAYIKVYGEIYDKNYYSYIINLNNLTEQFLKYTNFELADLINDLYDLYINSRNNDDHNKITYEKLVQFLQELPALNVLEVKNRHQRRKILKSKKTRKFNY